MPFYVVLVVFVFFSIIKKTPPRYCYDIVIFRGVDFMI